MTEKTEKKKKCDRFDFQDRAQRWPGLFLWQRPSWAAILTIFLILSVFVFFPISAQAEEMPKAPVPMLSRSISGEVGASTSRGFALVTKVESTKEYEMWFPFPPTVQFLGGYSSASDLQAGDKVLASYDEAQDGSKRILKSINLIKKGEPPAGKDSASTDSANQTL